MIAAPPRSGEGIKKKKKASPDVRLELTALGLKVPRANPSFQSVPVPSQIISVELTIVPAGRKKKACPLPDSNWRPWDICSRAVTV